MNSAMGIVAIAHKDGKVGFCSLWFISSAAVILAVTGVAKVWTAFAPTKVLAVADPITGVSFGHLMLAVGVLELVIAGICIFGKSQFSKLLLIAWLATTFVVYRIGLWLLEWKKPCSCLGNLTDALHLSPLAADNIMKVILAYLLIGSYGLLIWQWRASGPNVKKGSSQTDHQTVGNKDEVSSAAELQA